MIPPRAPMCTNKKRLFKLLRPEKTRVLNPWDPTSQHRFARGTGFFNGLFVLLVLALPAGGCSLFGSGSVSVPGTDISFDYVVRYSAGGDKGDDLPLLIALHGNGDTPEHFFETALDRLGEPARIVLLEAPLPQGLGGTGWPLDVDGVRLYGEAVAEAVRIIDERYTGPAPPAVFGFSGGAVIGYYLAAVYPERYSAVFPVSGLLTSRMIEGRDRSDDPRVRVYAFHGRQDQVIGFRGGSAASDLLRSRGIEVTFNAFDGGHLGVFNDAKEEITRALDRHLGASAL